MTRLEVIKKNNKLAKKYFFSKSTMEFFGPQKFKVFKHTDGREILQVSFKDKPNQPAYYEVIEDGRDLVHTNLYKIINN